MAFNSLIRLALKSAWSRKTPLILSLFSVAVSIALLIGVDQLRNHTKAHFMNSLSGTDLIVGARSGPVNLLLYSLFHLGEATHNIDYQSYLELQKMPQIDWTIPLSLGDSHRGFQVIGTNQDLYHHYRYAEKQALQFAAGKPFNDLYDVVIGAEVARRFDYPIGHKLTLAHGMNPQHAIEHKGQIFTVVGILEPTGTPIDDSLQVSLKALEAIHVGWHNGAPSGLTLTPELARKLAPQPQTVTAVLVGLKNPIMTFKVQRKINQFADEPLSAILPGATLAKFWKTLGMFEKSLWAIGALVLAAALLNILMVLLAPLNERRREIAILRALGCHARDVFKLFAIETAALMLSASAVGIALFYGLLNLAKYSFPQVLQFMPSLPLLTTQELTGLGLLGILALALSLIPAYIAYKRSLHDGLTPKL
ncbi:FtsX-like permease family protein [Thiomicrorhabdus sp.]|uniref:ABC transporter permease n=1 Tax=Thiomicrorhabdus sp. TaxID=2039724 RepID=UPI0029C88D9E|nr:FtsX-like permease family protein [Thiomicrorhabdus sp.]